MEAQVDAYGQAMRAHGQSELQERPESTRMRLCSMMSSHWFPHSSAVCLPAVIPPLPTTAFWLLSVWAFYEQEQKHQWRGQLAWSLFELQQQGDSAALHKVILGREERERQGGPTQANNLHAIRLPFPLRCSRSSTFFLLLSSVAVFGCRSPLPGLLCLQLLVAMARTHVSTLQKLLPRLWLLSNPLL